MRYGSVVFFGFDEESKVVLNLYEFDIVRRSICPCLEDRVSVPLTI